jgi:hypothetical protein
MRLITRVGVWSVFEDANCLYLISELSTIRVRIDDRDPIINLASKDGGSSCVGMPRPIYTQETNTFKEAEQILQNIKVADKT